MARASKPPDDLIAAFRATEAPEQLAALIIQDGGYEGFDAVAIRVLGAWSSLEQRWEKPDRPCPDEGRPTPRAWAWLVSGWRLDNVEIAEAADVSHSVAIAKMAVLLKNRLIYPTGVMSQWASSAIKNAIGRRAKMPGKRKEPEKKADEGAN